MSKEKPRFHRCSMCNRTAVWLYFPSHKGKCMFCDEHVPRGCGCNNYDIEFDGEPITGKKVAWWPRDKQDFSSICTERKTNSYHYQYLDNNGKLEPCCEFDYEPDGMEIVEMVTISPVAEVRKAISKALTRVGKNFSKTRKKEYREKCLYILDISERRANYVNHNNFMFLLTEFSAKPRPYEFRALTQRIKDILSIHRTTMSKEEWSSKKLQNKETN